MCNIMTPCFPQLAGLQSSQALSPTNLDGSSGCRDVHSGNHRQNTTCLLYPVMLVTVPDEHSQPIVCFLSIPSPPPTNVDIWLGVNSVYRQSHNSWVSAKLEGNRCMSNCASECRSAKAKLISLSAPRHNCTVQYSVTQSATPFAVLK